MEYNQGVVTNMVLTMFLVLCVGYAARKLKFLDGAFQKRLSDLIICVAQPFLILSSILNIEYSQARLLEGVLILGLGIAIHGVTAGIAFLAMFKIKDRDEHTLMEFGILFANCGFLGIPLLRAVFGDIGAFWGAFYVIVFNLVQWTYGMVILGRKNGSIKMNFKNILLNYGTVPCILGIVLFLIRLPIPSPVMSAASYIGSLCTPLSMIILGGALATIPVKKLFTNLKVYYFCAVKMLAVPFVVILLCRAAGLPADKIIFCAIMSALPTAANTVMFGERYDINPAFASHIVGMTTLLSAATVPLMVSFADILVKF